MSKHFNVLVVAVDDSSVMESRDHLLNGVNPKNHRSRRNEKFLKTCICTLVMVCMTITFVGCDPDDEPLKKTECYECTKTKTTYYSDNRPKEEKSSKTTKCDMSYSEIVRWAGTSPQSDYETYYIAGGSVQVTVDTRTTCKKK